MDYFSFKANHRGLHHGLRTHHSGPNFDTPLHSNFQGGRSHTMSSFFSENEKKSMFDTPQELQSPMKRSHSRLHTTWNMNHPPLKIPSNTAPGVRHIVGSLGSYSSILSSPIIATPTTPVFNKEGKFLHDPSSEMKIEYTNMECFDSERFFEYNHIPLMDTRGMAQRDVLRINYADMLYRWNLLDQRAEVLRFLNYQPFPLDNSEITSTNVHVSCYACGRELSSHDKYCFTCRKVRKLIRCCFCHILVKGLVNFCIHCGHGGHSNHMEDWFVKNQQVYCMTGCGCKCALESLELST